MDEESIRQFLQGILTKMDVQGVKHLCEWEGFDVYVPVVPHLTCSGYPKLALVKGDSIRVNTREEFMAIYDHLERNDPDALKRIGRSSIRVETFFKINSVFEILCQHECLVMRDRKDHILPVITIVVVRYLNSHGPWVAVPEIR